MRYTVLWSPEAEERLTVLWNEAANRQEITKAANSIDESLRIDPEKKGESRPDSSRIMFEAPLALTYLVNEEDRFVNVLTIWRFEKRKKT